MTERSTATDDGAGRWVFDTGIPGYGPDASNDAFSIADTWTALADIIRTELDRIADSEEDSASAYAASGDYQSAWETHKKAEEIFYLAMSFNNERRNAPLYKDDAPAWYATVQSLITERFPYDVHTGLRVYVWRDDEYGADSEED